jgi:DNA-binding transcriptional ArsR family regulator
VVEKLKEAAKKVRKRSVENAVSYAVAHGTRVDILCYLNEAPRSPSELARIMGLRLSTIEHHIKELLASRSIELARVEKVRNANEHFYRAVEIPYYTDEEMWAMPVEVRQEIYGLILQSSIAESMAAFRAGKMSNDPRVWMTWQWFNLDAQGRQDMADEDARSWKKRQEIEAESANRRAHTGEEPVSVIASMHTYERCRNLAARPPRSRANLASEKPFTR